METDRIITLMMRRSRTSIIQTHHHLPVLVKLHPLILERVEVSVLHLLPMRPINLREIIQNNRDKEIQQDELYDNDEGDKEQAGYSCTTVRPTAIRFGDHQFVHHAVVAFPRRCTKEGQKRFAEGVEVGDAGDKAGLLHAGEQIHTEHREDEEEEEEDPEHIAEGR